MTEANCDVLRNLLLLLLLLTRRLAWHLVQKLQEHVTHKKDMFGRQRDKVSSAVSTRTQTSTSSNVVWKSTVTTMMWQTTVNCSTRGQRRPGNRDPRSCCD